MQFLKKFKIRRKRLSRRKKNKLKMVGGSDIERFSFNGIITYCKVLKIYDGDTCTIAFYFNKKITKVSCRLSGIDTPELRSEDIQEKIAAVLAKNKLMKLINFKDQEPEPDPEQEPEQLLIIRFDKFDKYGRPIVTLYKYSSKSSYKNFENSINYLMIDQGYALKYDGGTKKKFDFDNYPLI